MNILSYDPNLRLPSAEELPDSDDTPVDNELQNFVPNLANDLLCRLWADRDDWFWGVDMGIYYHPEKPPLVPDGFLSLGVQRIKGINLRPSYVLWEEGGVIPILMLEVVSQTYGGEYDKKKQDYADLGVLYYVIYNPFCGQKRRYNQRQPLEVYRLELGNYELQSGNPLWLPEIGLGVGCEVGSHRGIMREWVYWYDETGQRYLTAEEEAQQERQRADRLAEYLRSQGIDPDNLP